MAVVTGTITGVHLVSAPVGSRAARKTYEVVANFASTTAGDSVKLVGINAAIEANRKDGKTFTARAAIAGNPGVDAAGASVYASPTITLDTGTLAFDLGTVTGDPGVHAGSKGVSIYVMGDES